MYIIEEKTIYHFLTPHTVVPSTDSVSEYSEEPVYSGIWLDGSVCTWPSLILNA